MSLPNDVCRCATKECLASHECARFTDKGEEGGWVMQCDFSDGIARKRCPMFLSVNEVNKC